MLDVAPLADDGAQALELPRELLVAVDCHVQCVTDLARDPCAVDGHAHREVTALVGGDDLQQFLLIENVCGGSRSRHGTDLLIALMVHATFVKGYRTA